MMGISYGGISQLFTAHLRPPDLEAIAPLSVIDATATTLYPGGTLNTGFAVSWAQQRQQEAEPAGPNWAGMGLPADPARRSDLRGQPGAARRGGQPDGQDRSELDLQPVGRRPARPDHLRPQDQRPDVHGLPVGGRADRRALSRSGPAFHRYESAGRFTFTNGAHIDSLDPATYNRLYDFLSRSSPTGRHPEPGGRERPRRPSSTSRRWASPRTDLVTLPPDPIQVQPTYESALSAFEALLRDPGAVRQRRRESPTGSTTAGDPYPGFEQSFSTFPIPGTTARSWYFGRAARSMQNASPRRGSTLTPHLRCECHAADGLRVQHRDGRSVGQRVPVAVELGAQPVRICRLLCLPRAADDRHHGDVGGGAVHLWVKSSTPDVDLQATVSEVRPDGNETFVQNGWLRANERKLSTTANNTQRAEAHAARAGPHLPGLRPRTDARGPVRPGRHPALLRGARLPRGLAHQGHDLGTQRNAADLVVLPHAACGHDSRGVGRLLTGDAVKPHPSRSSRCLRAPTGSAPARACATSPAAPTRQHS